jgi:phi13 family phage major tail protein
MARIGLKGLTCATVSGGGAGSAVTYTGGQTVADLMISADVSLNTEDAKLSADNHVVERANGITGGTISLELASLPNTLKTKLLGYTVSSKVLTVTGEAAPYVGFGYITCEITAGVKSYVGYWFPKVQFSMTDDSASTKGESTEFKTNTITGEIMSVVVTSSGPNEYYYTDTDSTEAAVRTWLNGKAGIS